MNRKILKIVIVAFLAAVIAATGFFRIPLPGLTGGIVIQNALCILTAVVLGSFLGAAPTALFFLVGALGLPVFSGWRGGFAEIANINGGFRVGWVLGALVAGLISGRSSVEEKNVTASYIVKISIAVVAGMLSLYIPEIFWVLAYKGAEAGSAGALEIFLTMYFLPFILVDGIKAVFVILLSIKLRPVVAQYIEE